MTKGRIAAVAVPAAGCVVALWAVWQLVTWLVVLGLVVGGCTAVGAGGRAIAQRNRRRAGQREMDYARFAAMSHLTEADERWLVQHFWVIPMETLRIRGGKAWDQPWTWAYAETKPLLVEQRERRVLEAEFHRKRVWGENVPVPGEISRAVEEEVEGEVVDFASGGVVKPINTTGIYTETAARTKCRHAGVTHNGNGWSICLRCGSKFKTTKPFLR